MYKNVYVIKSFIFTFSMKNTFIHTSSNLRLGIVNLYLFTNIKFYKNVIYFKLFFIYLYF